MILPCSGFWGVMCVGIFSKHCLIEEVYETACYCKELVLPDKVRKLLPSYFNHKYIFTVLLHSWNHKDYDFFSN